jgi:hypothetical protein
MKLNRIRVRVTSKVIVLMTSANKKEEQNQVLHLKVH